MEAPDEILTSSKIRVVGRPTRGKSWKSHVQNIIVMRDEETQFRMQTRYKKAPAKRSEGSRRNPNFSLKITLHKKAKKSKKLEVVQSFYIVIRDEETKHRMLAHY